MSISNLSVAIGTAIGVTGGTATAVISKGDSLGKHEVVLDDGSAFSDETRISFSTKEPRVSASAPAGYTQKRNTIVVQVPKTLANANTTINSARIEFSVDSETTSAEYDALRELAAQLIFDTDLDQYYNSQAVS
jgi:hypothetical protein